MENIFQNLVGVLLTRTTDIVKYLHWITVKNLVFQDCKQNLRRCQTFSDRTHQERKKCALQSEEYSKMARRIMNTQKNY